MKKEDVGYVYTAEYYSFIKRNDILPLAAMQMDIENITLSEISQTEKDLYSMLSLICGTNQVKVYSKTGTHRYR